MRSFSKRCRLWISNCFAKGTYLNYHCQSSKGNTAVLLVLELFSYLCVRCWLMIMKFPAHLSYPKVPYPSYLWSFFHTKHYYWHHTHAYAKYSWMGYFNISFADHSLHTGVSHWSPLPGVELTSYRPILWQSNEYRSFDRQPSSIMKRLISGTPLKKISAFRWLFFLATKLNDYNAFFFFPLSYLFLFKYLSWRFLFVHLSYQPTVSGVHNLHKFDHHKETLV